MEDQEAADTDGHRGGVVLSHGDDDDSSLFFLDIPYSS